MCFGVAQVIQQEKGCVVYLSDSELQLHFSILHKTCFSFSFKNNKSNVMSSGLKYINEYISVSDEWREIFMKQFCK